MTEAGSASPFGSLILLGILAFIVWRILQAINTQNPEKSSDRDEPKTATVFHMPESRPSPPPSTVDLVAWPEEAGDPFVGYPLAQEAETTLVEKNGLVRIGAFTVPQMPGYTLRAYTHPETSLVGIVYKDAGGDVWLNLLSAYLDGRVVTTSSADKDKQPAPRPRGMPLYSYPHLPLDQVFRRHKLETRAPEKYPPVTADAFAAFYRGNYERLRREVVTASQERPAPPIPFPRPIRREEEEVDIGLPMGPAAPVTNGPPPPPTPSQLKAWLKSIYRAVKISEEKRDEFTRGLVWVQEKAPTEAVLATIRDYADVGLSDVGGTITLVCDGEERRIDRGDLAGPALFERINQSLPSKRRFFKVPVSLKGVAFYSRLAP